MSLPGLLAPPDVAIAETATPPSPTTSASPRPTLRPGSAGATVEELQALLTLLGYYEGTIDGTYQPDLQEAVQRFQGDAGVTADGIVGPATWSRLLPTPSTDLTPPEVTVSETTATSPPEESTSNTAAAGETAPESSDRDPTASPVELPTLRSEMYGPAVLRVQERLQRLNFYSGALDGVFGPQTEAAVKAFQRSVRLTADGIVGPATWRALLQ